MTSQEWIDELKVRRKAIVDEYTLFVDLILDLENVSDFKEYEEGLEVAMMGECMMLKSRLDKLTERLEK